MAFNALGNVSNTASLVQFAVQTGIGIVAYRNIGSPHKTLKGSWETLRNIQTHLRVVTPSRRQAIEAAAAMNKCRTLKDIEGEFQNLWDMHSDLSQKYEESSYIQRHLSGELRSLINRLDVDVKTLLYDTRTTTRAQPIIPTLTPRPSGDQSNFFPIFPFLPPIPTFSSLSLLDQSSLTDIASADSATSPSVPFAIRESIEMRAV